MGAAANGRFVAHLKKRSGMKIPKKLKTQDKTKDESQVAHDLVKSVLEMIEFIIE